MSSAHITVVIGKQESRFISFLKKFWGEVLLQAWVSDLWTWLEDGGRLWMCLRIRSTGRIYLCSGACWIRSRIKYVPEKAAKQSNCVGFQQLRWDMTNYKLVWICWGEGWPRGFQDLPGWRAHSCNSIPWLHPFQYTDEHCALRSLLKYKKMMEKKSMTWF